MVRVLLFSTLIFAFSSIFALNADSLLMNQESQSDSALIANYKTIHSYYLKQAPDSALVFASRGLEIAKERGNKIFIVDMLIRMSVTYIDITDYPKAQKYSTEALQLAEEIEYVKAIPIICNNIGIIYATNKDYDKAIEYYTKAIKADSLLNDMIGVGIDLSNLSEILMLNNEKEKARNNYKLVLDIYEKYNVKSLQSMTLNNIGELFLYTDSYDSALLYLRKAVNLKKQLNQDIKLPNSYILLGETHLKTRYIDSAFYYYKMAYEMANQNGLPRDAMHASLGLSQYYKQKKDYKLAYSYYKLYSSVKDSVFNVDKNKQINELEIRYQVDKKDVEIHHLSSEIIFHKKIRNLVILVVILIIALFFVLYKRFRLKTLLLEKENQLEKEKSKQFKLELEAKNRELLSQSMVTIQKNQTLNELKEQLKQIDDYTTTCNVALKLIDESYSIDKDWESLKIHFEKVHADFFANLQKEYPELTANDLRHCAYIKIQMSTKDVARIMNVDPKSVKMTRYRLKKKFSLDADTSLESFINDF